MKKLKSYGKASNRLMPLHQKIATGHMPKQPKISGKMPGKKK